MIAAVARNGVIGADGKLPWHIPEDLKRFKKLTTGHAIIMGRKTYESIGRALPNSHNIVVTNTLAKIEGCTVAKMLQDAINLAYAGVGAGAGGPDPTPFVIGGATIFEEAMPLTTRIYYTVVDRTVEGDVTVTMPLIDPADWTRSFVEAREDLGATFDRDRNASLNLEQYPRLEGNWNRKVQTPGDEQASTHLARQVSKLAQNG